MPCCSTLKSDSRRRSEVGRIASDFGVASERPRQRPPTILTAHRHGRRPFGPPSATLEATAGAAAGTALKPPPAPPFGPPLGAPRPAPSPRGGPRRGPSSPPARTAGHPADVGPAGTSRRRRNGRAERTIALGFARSGITLGTSPERSVALRTRGPPRTFAVVAAGAERSVALGRSVRGLRGRSPSSVRALNGRSPWALRPRTARLSPLPYGHGTACRRLDAKDGRHPDAAVRLEFLHAHAPWRRTCHGQDDGAGRSSPAGALRNPRDGACGRPLRPAARSPGVRP